MDNPTNNGYSFQLPLFDFHDLRPSFFSEDEMAFYRYLSTIESLLTPVERKRLFSRPRTGRTGYSDFQILAIVVLKSFARCSTVREVLGILRNEPNYRYIIGLGRTPSEGSLSRRVKTLDGLIDIGAMHSRLARSFFSDRMVCNLSMDSSIVDAYEKPAKKERKPKGRRGRKARGSAEEAEHLERLRLDKELKELRDHGDADEYLRTLEGGCTVAGKRNSKGNMDWRIGYKAHLAVDDNGIVVSYAITGACVNDMQPAIPLLRKADGACTYLYALMDAGYWSEEIRSFARSIGKVPVIDPKADRNGGKVEMDPAGKQRYKARTTVERTNSELKACFLPDHLRSRGCKARLDIAVAILLLTMKRMRMVLMKEQRFRGFKAA